MGLWAEPFTTLRLQKIFNLIQDPFERADITSNTFWDWNLNHVGQHLRSAWTRSSSSWRRSRSFPPRSFPPSFNPANIMESTLDDIKEERRLKEGLDVDRIRDRLNQMIDQRFRERSIR